MIDRYYRFVFCLLGATTACLAGHCSAVAQSTARPIQFDRDIRPILSENCFACHGFDSQARQADLRLDSFSGATGQAGGTAAVVPFKPADSELVARVFSDDPTQVMPPPDSGKRLSAAQRQLLSAWIEQGAAYDVHWSFVPPNQNQPPEVAGAKHPIDRFIQARLMDQGLQPSGAAAFPTLIRRVSLDLTGLPPTLSEIDSFVAAATEDPVTAYHALVERLLSSPHYGERWGLWWLDQARYADSNGYSVDAPAKFGCSAIGSLPP